MADGDATFLLFTQASVMIMAYSKMAFRGCQSDSILPKRHFWLFSQKNALHSAKCIFASLDKLVVFGSIIKKLLKCKGDWFFYVYKRAAEKREEMELDK